MQLLNFCIGQVRTIYIGGEPVQTGYIKAPVAEPWIITEEGPLGDRRAAHPDKVYAFARTGYRHWGRYLDVDPDEWPDGLFGENLTLDSLDENEVHLGDVFAIGDAVQLVVAGTRTPCAKLAWRLNQPRTFQAIFARSRNTGVYFDVLNPGEVRPGDVLRRIEHDPNLPTLAECQDMVAGTELPAVERLQKTLDLPRLSQTVRFLLQSKLEAAERAAAAAEGRWPGWRPFRINNIVEEATDIRSYHLVPVDGEPLCQPRAGQFVSVRLQSQEGSFVTRCWSLSDYAPDMTGYRVTVRRQQGPGSTLLHQTKVGAIVELRTPAGDFNLDMGGFRPVVLIAAGIGITPLLAMMRAQLSRDGGAPVHLIYGARTASDMAFRNEIEALAAGRSDVFVRYVFSQASEVGALAGRITADTVIEALSDLHFMLNGHRIDIPWFESDMYLCGPGNFCHTLRDALVARGANADRTFYEHFTGAHSDDVAAVDHADIRFSLSDRTVRWDAEDDLTLLDIADQARIEIKNDCRAGSCLTCKTRVVAGDATVTIDGGFTLPCIARPKSDLLVLEA